VSAAHPTVQDLSESLDHYYRRLVAGGQRALITERAGMGSVGAKRALEVLDRIEAEPQQPDDCPPDIDPDYEAARSEVGP
jgi:hypothetical protein